MLQTINKKFPIIIRSASVMFVSLSAVSVGIGQFDTLAEERLDTISAVQAEFFLRIEHNTIKTLSNFIKTQETVTSVLPHTRIFQDSDDLYIGEEKIIEQGFDGSTSELFDVYWWNGEEIDRTLVSTQRIEPQTTVILRGTKKNIRTLDTPIGALSYFNVFRMWATSYDSNCKGCTGVTFTGTSVHHGVCAVDPRVIPLGSQMYIPGYGLCRAEDIGGAIKGNKIDLGFTDVKTGWWGARYTDVYLLELETSGN